MAPDGAEKQKAALKISFLAASEHKPDLQISSGLNIFASEF